MLRLLLVLLSVVFACTDDGVVNTEADSGPGDARETVDDTSPATAPADTPEPETSPVVTAELEVVATVPANTPADATIHLTGNRPELGDWDGVGVALARGDDGRWRVTLSLPLETELEFKLTRGSWETVEKDAAGDEIENRTHMVDAERATLELTVASWRDLPPGPPAPSRIEFIHGVSSSYLGPSRDVIIYLPPGYDSAPSARYPVLYMHDGQNLMDPTTSAFGVAWEVDDTATRLIGDGVIEPVIIVGIYNTADRMAEYTHTADRDYGGGDADAYGRFIADELKPDVDDSYRTVADAARTGLAGSSLGGLVSLYLGLERSATFGRIGAVSPSIWWADQDIVGRVEALAEKLPLRIWLDMGTGEGTTSIDDARALRDVLVGEGWVLGEDLFYQEYPGAGHDEAAWAARCDDILQALYPR